MVKKALTTSESHCLLIKLFWSSWIENFWPTTFSYVLSSSTLLFSSHSSSLIIVLSFTITDPLSILYPLSFILYPELFLFSHYLGALGMNFDYVVHFYFITGSFSAVFALTLLIIIIGTPAYIFCLEVSGALPRMMKYRPNTSKNRNKNIMIKNKYPPGDFKGSDVMGISSMMI